MEDCVFDSCRNLNIVTFAPESRLEKIGSNCFSWSKIKNIVVPKSVKEVQNGAFFECQNLREVVFEKESRLAALGELAFQNCDDLTKITLPDELKSTGLNAFWGCKSLKSIQLPNGLEKIGEQCFRYSDL